MISPQPHQSRFQYIMQSLLTCRTLFELRQHGNCTVRGNASAECNSSLSAPLDTLVFRQRAAGSSDILRASHVGRVSPGGMAHDDE
jgi:hypothetical protein